MVETVELAMSLIQLTGVLIPLLLGMIRYVINQEGDETIRKAGRAAVMVLSIPLYATYIYAYYLIRAYGNSYLTNAVGAYGVFLVVVIVLVHLSLFWHPGGRQPSLNREIVKAILGYLLGLFALLYSLSGPFYGILF